MKPSIKKVFIGRQEIRDKDLSIYGYELLYRQCENNNYCDVIDHSEATKTVIKNSTEHFNLKDIVGGKYAFLNFPQKMIEESSHPILQSDKTVIEILEHTQPSPDVILGILELKEMGYIIALDDFDFENQNEILLSIADIVKVDIEGLSLKDLFEKTKAIQDLTDAKLLAERVETEKQLDACIKNGYELFQGFFFSKPELLTKKIN